MAEHSAFWKANRPLGFIIIILSYLLALLTGLAVFSRLAQDLWFRLLIADIAATFSIWICSQVFANASIYDPYWSVQPIVILDLLLIKTGLFSLPAILLCLVVSLWGIRLTANWAMSFQGLHAQDWRYDLIKSKTGRLYPLANLIGIQMMPTLVVYACILPASIYISQGGGFNGLTAIGLLISLTGLVLESVSDYQIHNFQQLHKDRTRLIHSGLWRYSRHPNYLGEIMMWWGVFAVLLSSWPAAWYLGIGAFLNTALFIFISIPMAEAKLAGYKADYAMYRQKTPMLLPLPRKGLLFSENTNEQHKPQDS
jgi:steroid 5-alpha reductase family enzyme